MISPSIEFEVSGKCKSIALDRENNLIIDFLDIQQNALIITPEFADTYIFIN